MGIYIAALPAYTAVVSKLKYFRTIHSKTPDSDATLQVEIMISSLTACKSLQCSIGLQRRTLIKRPFFHLSCEVNAPRSCLQAEFLAVATLLEKRVQKQDQSEHILVVISAMMSSGENPHRTGQDSVRGAFRKPWLPCMALF